jgi:ubiquinone/menaquinone biosynthesis C-methylase UbiE
VSEGFESGRNQQSAVDAQFRRRVDYWRDVYSDGDPAGSVYRRRRLLALAWIDGLELPHSMRVLDVGCGTGPLSVMLAERGYHVDAVDSVQEMVDATQRNGAEAGIADRLCARVADAARLPFKDDAFALVTALGVLPWVPSPQAAILEAARVAAPGGHVLFSADNRASLQGFIDPLFNPLLAPAKRVSKRALTSLELRPETPTLNRPVSLRALDTMLSRARLRRVRQTTIGFMPLTIFRRPILPAGVSRRIDPWLHEQVDRGRPFVRAAGMQHLVLARKDVAPSGSEARQSAR